MVPAILHYLRGLSLFFCLCVLFIWPVCFFQLLSFFRNSMLLASSKLLDSSGKKAPLFWGLLYGGEKKPLHFLYVEHRRAHKLNTLKAD